MYKSRITILLVAAMITGLWASLEIRTHAKSMSYFGVGPDIIAGDIPSLNRWGVSGGETSFSIGTTSCNVGTERLVWIANSNEHPLMSQNLYRVRDGRIEQLGMSWPKHGFFALSQSLCNQCDDPSNGTFLGVGCSTSNSSASNGAHSLLGPRSEVNAATGFFLWPHGNLPQSSTLDGRISVANSDLDPAQNVGARYFFESQFIHPQDAASDNDNNNSSYREAFARNLGDGNFDLNFGGPPTRREQPAIAAWKAVYPDVRLFNVDIPDDGRIIVGIRATKTLGGYHTEIAIENLTSHRSVRSLGVKFSSSSISNPEFNDVDYQYEPYSGDDWAPSIDGNQIEWATETFAKNEDANAIRWSTLYSFSCDSADCPSQLTLGLYRPGANPEITIDICDSTIYPDSYEVTRGSYVAGGLAELAESDNMDLSLRRLNVDIQSRTEFEVTSTSPTATPTDFEFTLEGSVFARTNVVQTIELYDFGSAAWELVDTRDAVRTPSPDSTVTVASTGDLSRFVEAGTLSIKARVRYKSDVPRQSFASDTDQTIWMISQ